jgi:hypothetical protein
MGRDGVALMARISGKLQGIAENFFSHINRSTLETESRSILKNGKKGNGSNKTSG